MKMTKVSYVDKWHIIKEYKHIEKMFINLLSTIYNRDDCEETYRKNNLVHSICNFWKYLVVVVERSVKFW